MKELIKDIKYNRLPVEVLHLITKLNDINNHVLFMGDMLIKCETQNILFCLNHSNKSIIGYINIIDFHIMYNFSQSYNFNDISEIINIIKQTIKNSNYSHYETKII